MANERVLIINNSIAECEFIVEQVLTPNGYASVIGADCDQTQTLLAQLPDLILMDLSTVEAMDCSPLAMMAQQGLTVPVVVLVGQDVESLPLGLLRQGAKAYVTKPFEAADVLAAIEQSLTETRLCQERATLIERLKAADDRIEQHLKELNTLFGVGKSVTAAFNREQLFSRLVEAAIYLTRAEESSLLLVDETSDELYVAATRGMDEWSAHSLRVSVADSLAGSVVTSGQALILDQEALTEADPDSPATALMYVPLYLRGQIKGVLGVTHRQQHHTFTNHQLRLLSTLADYGAIFLDSVQLTDQIEREQAKLNTILDEISQPIALLDEQNRLLSANVPFRCLFDLEQTAATLQPVTDLLTHQRFLEFITSDANDGHYREIFLDDERTFAAVLAPIAHVGRALIMQDITHFKSLNQTKSNFIFTAAQTMQSPLVSVREYADMLQTAGSLTEKQEMFFDRVVQGVDNMIGLLNNLLDLKQVENGSDLSLTVFDLGQITAEVVAEFQTQARHKRQQLVYHAPLSPAFVMGAPLRLRQVIGHLLDNAIKYTPDGGRIATIIQVEGEQVILKVEDDGAGIPAADLPFIFDKFFRVERKQQPLQPGMGLGLAICKTVIEKYDGTIWVESVYGQGSTFFITLPFASPESDDQSAIDLAPSESILSQTVG